MRPTFRTSSWLVLLCAAAVLAAGGCAYTQPASSGADTAALSCAAAGKVETQVSPEAELTGLDCFFKDYKGVKSLHFKVTLKNTSDQPQRYRVNLFLDNGKAVGGLIPRKGKPPVVKPGEAASFTYPVKGMSEPAGEVLLLVKTISQ